MQALLGASTRFLLLKLDQAYEVRLRTRLPGLESHQPSSAASRASPSRGLAAVPHTIAHACKMGRPPCATRDADFSRRMHPASNHPSPTTMHCVHAPWLYPFFSRACSTPVRQGWGESTFGEVEMLGAEQRTSPRSSFESRPSCIRHDGSTPPTTPARRGVSRMLSPCEGLECLPAPHALTPACSLRCSCTRSLQPTDLSCSSARSPSLPADAVSVFDLISDWFHRRPPVRRHHGEQSDDQATLSYYAFLWGAPSVYTSFREPCRVVGRLGQLAPSCAVGRYGPSGGFWLGAPVPSASGVSLRPNPAGFGIGCVR